MLEIQAQRHRGHQPLPRATTGTHQAPRRARPPICPGEQLSAGCGVGICSLGQVNQVNVGRDPLRPGSSQRPREDLWTPESPLETGTPQSLLCAPTQLLARSFRKVARRRSQPESRQLVTETPLGPSTRGNMPRPREEAKYWPGHATPRRNLENRVREGESLVKALGLPGGALSPSLVQSAPLGFHEPLRMERKAVACQVPPQQVG